MPAIDKSALRAAVLIHEHLATPCPPRRPIHLSDYHWNEAQRLVRQIEQAHHRGWRRAAESLNTDLARMLENFQRELGWAVEGLKAHKAPPQIAAVADMYHDILALDDEFDRVEIDVKEHVLRVTTDRIVLDDVRLGRFEICLDWRDLGKPSPYRVVALDPNPAATDSDVTHPHVRNEALCEGEGIRPIAAALAEGRLLDFFQLVSQILHNYGRGSAYVELDDWDGESCRTAGARSDRLIPTAATVAASRFAGRAMCCARAARSPTARAAWADVCPAAVPRRPRRRSRSAGAGRLQPAVCGQRPRRLAGRIPGLRAVRRLA